MDVPEFLGTDHSTNSIGCHPESQSFQNSIDPDLPDRRSPVRVQVPILKNGNLQRQSLLLARDCVKRHSLVGRLPVFHIRFFRHPSVCIQSATYRDFWPLPRVLQECIKESGPLERAVNLREESFQQESIHRIPRGLVCVPPVVG